MQSFFKAIGYRGSKNDRSVLKWLLVIGFFLVVVIALIAIPIFWNAYLDPQIKRDKLKLDSILADGKIDAVEIISLNGPNGEQTNRLVGEEMLKFLTSLNHTNRVNNVDWTKQQQESVTLLNGTNRVIWLHRGEDGAWEFEKYGFRLRQ